jgi:hypothetical protein
LWLLQVAKYYGDTEEEQRQRLLQPLLDAAEAAEPADRQQLPLPAVSSAALPSDLDSDSDEGEEIVYTGRPAAAAAAARVRRIRASRRRVTNLSESQAAVIKETEQRYRRNYGQQGDGHLVTAVIRAVKAWSKYGLPAALQAGGAAADEAKPPPNYLWEVFVLFVLEQGCRQGRRYKQEQPLQLFMDVMEAAAQRLRCSDAPSTDQQQQQHDQEPIMLEVFYSRRQAQLPSFSGLWGCGPLYRPAIINPVDPAYNCTAWQAFRHWDDLAAAAGALHAQLQHSMQGRAGGEGAGSSAAAAAAGGNAWQRLCEDSSCTLGAAVRAFEQ